MRKCVVNMKNACSEQAEWKVSVRIANSRSRLGKKHKNGSKGTEGKENGRK